MWIEAYVLSIPSRRTNLKHMSFPLFHFMYDGYWIQKRKRGGGGGEGDGGEWEGGRRTHQAATELSPDCEKRCSYRVTVLHMHMLACLLITQVMFLTAVLWLWERWRTFYFPPTHTIGKTVDKVLARKGRERQFEIRYSWNKKGVEVWPLRCLQQFQLLAGWSCSWITTTFTKKRF